MREFLQGFLGSAVSNQAPQYLQVQLIIINDYYDEMHDYTSSILFCNYYFPFLYEILNIYYIMLYIRTRTHVKFISVKSEELNYSNFANFAEPDERNIPADGHDTPISGTLRSVQESHGSDLRRTTGNETLNRIIYFTITLMAQSI